MGFSAASFEHDIVAALFRPFAEDLVRRAEMHSGERVLDVACGSSIVGRIAAAGRGAAVYGLDLDANRLQVGLTAARHEGVTLNLCRASAEQLPYPDRAFDVVLCQFGLMLFGDAPAALQEMRRILTPGGRLLLSVWDTIDRHPFDKLIHETSLRRLGVSGLQDVFSLGDSSDLLRLLESAGYSDIRIASHSLTAHFADPSAYLDWELDADPDASPVLRHLDAAARRAEFAAARAELQLPMQSYIKDGRLVLDFHAHVALARA